MKLLRMKSSLAGRFPRGTTDTASREGGELTSGEGGTTAGVAALDPFLYEEPRWCVNCGGEQRFFPCFEFAGGRVGVCLGCGDERVIPFSRTNAEAC